MGHVPVRRCLACRRVAPKPELVRVAVAGETVVVDPPARQPGRGAYLCTSEACLDAALRRRGAALLRALRRSGGQVTVEEDAIRTEWDDVARGAGSGPHHGLSSGSHHGLSSGSHHGLSSGSHHGLSSGSHHGLSVASAT